MRLLDLREFVRQDFGVTLPNGVEYLLPGDIDTERMLWFLDLQKRFVEASDEESVDILRDMQAKTLELFQIRQPDLEWVDLGLSVEHISLLFAKLVAAYNEGPEDDSDPPTSPRAARRSPRNSPRSASNQKKKGSSGRTSSPR